MTAVYKVFLNIRFRLGQLLSLIFFVCLFAQSCRLKAEGITIVWKGNDATGIIISTVGEDDLPKGSGSGWQVRLQGNTTTMLGSFKTDDGITEFTPLIPLSPNADYEVFYNDKQMGTVHIPAPNPANSSYVINIFPAVDTVPVNLLKIYVQFSAPMRQGEALQHIHLVNEQNDTVPNVFLDLQPELWDTEGKVLTVWLDPGRIKRDLIPNQQLGNPLQPGKRYSIVVSNNWKDAQGLPLRKLFTRQFTAGERDSISPQPQLWKLELPAANTAEGLGINFSESLDYFLVSETITIIDEKGNTVAGKSGPLSNGTGYAFWPEKLWPPGAYQLKVASVLEDLAGNNLNRLFDRDLKVKKIAADKEFVERVFVIKCVQEISFN